LREKILFQKHKPSNHNDKVTNVSVAHRQVITIFTSLTTAIM